MFVKKTMVQIDRASIGMVASCTSEVSAKVYSCSRAQTGSDALDEVLSLGYATLNSIHIIDVKKYFVQYYTTSFLPVSLL